MKPLWRGAALVVGVLLYAGLSHWLMLYHAAHPWALVVLMGPLWLTLLGMALARLGAWGWMPALALAALLVVVVERGGTPDANRLYVAQHVGINLLLGGWFGLSLRGRPLTLIGQLASRLHSSLTPAMVAYTRNVTATWTIYFFAMALLSCTVYAALPFATWSFFSNVLAPASIAGLFACEHVLRYVLHPEFERVTMRDAIRAFQARPDSKFKTP